jgi:hypothetical protein
MPSSMHRVALPSLLLLVSCHKTAPPAPVTSDPAEAAVAAAPLDPSDPASLSGTAEDSAQIDPSLAYAPGALLVAWTSLRPQAPSVVRVRLSRDEGATWEGSQTIVAPDNRASSEPQLAMDSAGNVYLAWLAVRTIENGDIDAKIYVSRAAAGAASFGPPVEVSDQMRHGTRLAAPRMTVTGAGTVVLTWSYAHPNGDGIGLARTTDGEKWSRGVVIERIDLGARLPTVCAASHSDRVWVTYLDKDAGVRIRASDDGGNLWAPARVATVSTPEDLKSIASEAPLCAGNEDAVTVAYARDHGHDAGAGPASSLVVARSVDGGRMFDVRHVYDATPLLLTAPQIAVEPDGAADVAFYASGSSPDGGSIRWFHIDERGALSPARTAREGLRFQTSAAEADWPGHTFGWAWHEGALFVASVANRDGKAHVTFARVAAIEARGGPAPSASHERERPAVP